MQAVAGQAPFVTLPLAAGHTMPAVTQVTLSMDNSLLLGGSASKPEVRAALVRAVARVLSIPQSSVVITGTGSPDWTNSEGPSSPVSPVQLAVAEQADADDLALVRAAEVDGAAREMSPAVDGSLPQAAPAAPPLVLYVSVDGRDAVGCGRAGAPCATIRFAVSLLNSALPLAAVATFIVGPGTYGPSSCGAMAFRNTVLAGAGSSTTFFWCGGASPLLTTNASLTMSGISVAGGLLNASMVTLPSSNASLVAWGGGGAVSAMWSTRLQGASAMFSDVRFENNSVVGTAPSLSAASLVGGGGAVFVCGGGNGSTVVVSNCSFTGNTVSVATPAPSEGCGGGMCVALGWGLGSDVNISGPLFGASITVSNVVAVNNSVSGPGSSC